jgi:flagellin-like protein
MLAMRIKKLLDDDNAVSPVIGVILMVAITVILAAVIASFVLGLGNQTGEVSPTASFTFDYDNSAQEVTVTHDTGEAIPVNQLYIRGQNIDTGTGDYPGQWADGGSGDIEGETAVVSGDSATVNVDDDAYTVRVVWQSDSNETSSTLSEDSGPGA